MEWFRWHSGTVSDPKFQWVALKSGQSVAVVLAMWAVVLERANACDDRGDCSGLDFESLDVALGIEDGAALAVYQTFERKEMIVDGVVANWSKRQPKHEDSTNAARQKRYRESRKALRYVTDSNGTSHHVTTEEIRREEKRKEEPSSSSSSSSLTLDSERASDPLPEATTTTKKADLFQLRVWHEQYFNALLPGGLNNLASGLCRRFTAEAIEAAFEAAARYNVPKLAYVEAVLTGEKRGRASPQRKEVDWDAVESIRKEGGFNGASICSAGA